MRSFLLLIATVVALSALPSIGSAGPDRKTKDGDSDGGVDGGGVREHVSKRPMLIVRPVDIPVRGPLSNK